MAQEVDFYSRLVSNFHTDSTLPGKGLDIGTTHVVAVACDGEGNRVYNAQRNAFIHVRSDAFTHRMLEKLGVRWQEIDGRATVIGDPAFELANIFEKEVNQPVCEGVINPGDPHAIHVLRAVVEQVLGKPKIEGEPCTLSMPADPLDSVGNVIYHRGVVLNLVRELGYRPVHIGSADAMCFSELVEDGYTGITISCGGGMFNVAVTYKSIPAIRFAIARGGDWIDENTARAIGLPRSQVCALKESGLDLTDTVDHTHEAMAIYTQSLIRYTLETIRDKFAHMDSAPTFVREVPVVVAGGLAKTQGFTELFESELRNVEFPIPVSGVRIAKDPDHAVVDGCLEAADVLTDYSDENERHLS